MNRFMENAAAFTEAFGVQQAPLVVWLSLMPWENREDRDNFIYATTGVKASGTSVDERTY